MKLNTFEADLLDELKRVVDGRAQAERRRSRVRPLLLGGAGVSVAAAAAAVLSISPVGPTTQPAYAIITDGHGSTIVTIHGAAAIPAAEAALRARGLPVKLAAVATGNDLVQVLPTSCGPKPTPHPGVTVSRSGDTYVVTIHETTIGLTSATDGAAPRADHGGVLLSVTRDSTGAPACSIRVAIGTGTP